MITDPTLRYFQAINPEAEIRTHTEIRYQSGRKRVIKEPHIIQNDAAGRDVIIITRTHIYNIPVEVNIEELVTKDD